MKVKRSRSTISAAQGGVTGSYAIIGWNGDKDEEVTGSNSPTPLQSIFKEAEKIGKSGKYSDIEIHISFKQGVQSSTRSSRKPIMAGAGAAYTITYTIDSVDSVKSFDIVSQKESNDFSEPTYDIVIKCDIDVTVTIKDASSYYDGIGGDNGFEAPAKITKFALFDVTQEELDALNGDGYYETLIDLMNGYGYNGSWSDALMGTEWKVTYGWGWSHVKYNGVLADSSEDFATGSEIPAECDIYLTNQEDIDYIDRAVTGEDGSEYWELFDQDNEIIGDSYYSLMDAQNAAEELIATGDYDSITCVRVFSRYGRNGDFIDDYRVEEFTIDEPADL